MAKRYTAEALDDLKPVVEALIFASDEPLSVKQLRTLIEGEKKSKKKKNIPVAEAAGENIPAEILAQESETVGTSGELESVDDEESDKGGLDARAIRGIVDALNAAYTEAGRSFLIIEIAGGFQFATRKEFGLYVGRLAKDKSRRRLSQAALETLAIVAYRQPLAKPDIEAVRGVNCDEVLSSLMERGLITITGRAETVGRPLLYGTTDDFLKYFGLVSLKDLPRPREIDEMMEARGILAEQMTLELSSEENAAQIEEHLSHYFGSAEVIAKRGGLGATIGGGETTAPLNIADEEEVVEAAETNSISELIEAAETVIIEEILESEMNTDETSFIANTTSTNPLDDDVEEEDEIDDDEEIEDEDELDEDEEDDDVDDDVV